MKVWISSHVWTDLHTFTTRSWTRGVSLWIERFNVNKTIRKLKRKSFYEYEPSIFLWTSLMHQPHTVCYIIEALLLRLGGGWVGVSHSDTLPPIVPISSSMKGTRKKNHPAPLRLTGRVAAKSGAQKWKNIKEQPNKDNTINDKHPQKSLSFSLSFRVNVP